MTHRNSATITGSKSHWHSLHGITLSTTLKDLERFNGKPFHLSGFGWDYAGTVLSWDEGHLAAELDGGQGRVILRLDSEKNARVTEEENLQVAGDLDFSSQHPIMQKLNPSAYQIIWVFPQPKD